MFLAENLIISLSASIAFDWSNAKRTKPKFIYVNPKSSYFASGNPSCSVRKEQRDGLASQRASMI